MKAVASMCSMLSDQSEWFLYEAGLGFTLNVFWPVHTIIHRRRTTEGQQQISLHFLHWHLRKKVWLTCASLCPSITFFSPISTCSHYIWLLCQWRANHRCFLFLFSFRQRRWNFPLHAAINPSTSNNLTNLDGRLPGAIWCPFQFFTGRRDELRY